ncbi:helix-turn-helix domain-containing protein [Streptococcus gallolyticus]|uniref:helix-turn-helix domain-containing protein n=1 Tax=Streptococcus gallolyticus TaxID=315405 RepID=UPI003756B452
MNRLKELRKAKKLTQQELAEKTDIPYRTLQRWENGESQIKPDKAQKLADFFGVSIAHLLGYDDNDFEKQIRIDTLNNLIYKMHTAYVSLLEKNGQRSFLGRFSNSRADSANAENDIRIRGVRKWKMNTLI